MTHPNPWLASLWTYERVIARPMCRVTVGHGRGERVDKHLLIRRWLDQILDEIVDRVVLGRLVTVVAPGLCWAVWC
jgi:hypothetical protein